jgi:hypothetical protein
VGLEENNFVGLEGNHFVGSLLKSLLKWGNPRSRLKNQCYGPFQMIQQYGYIYIVKTLC